MKKHLTIALVAIYTITFLPTNAESRILKCLDANGKIIYIDGTIKESSIRCDGKKEDMTREVNKWSKTPDQGITKEQKEVNNCPCSGSNNCYGYRGGQFCITSGGKKRYR